MIKILLTGGGTGGHIYPLVAVADELKSTVQETKEEIKLFYLGPKSFLNEEFEKRDIKIYHIASSKLRRYFSVLNAVDIPKFFWSIVQALFRLYFLMPHVVFSKGGPGALAVVLAARFYFIPVIIHESDSVPGFVNRLSARLAKRIVIAFPHAANYFPVAKTSLAGNPIRNELFGAWLDLPKAKERIRFNPQEPVVLILGGSQGSVRINNFVFENLESLLQVTQIHHQVGEASLRSAQSFIREEFQNRYRIVGYFDAQGIREAFNAADLVISRAGAGAIFEIAGFHKPSILIPLAESANDHQRINAYEYEKSGAAIVIEEENFKIHIVLVQIKNILNDPTRIRSMSEAAKQFSKPQAAELIAKEILKLAPSFWPS